MKISYRQRISEACLAAIDRLAERTGIRVVRDRLSHPSLPDVVTLEVSGYRQAESFTCGFVAGLMVLHTFRPSASIDRFYRAVNPTRLYGASTRKVASALRRSGIGVSIRHNLDFKAIQTQINNGFPIITCIKTSDPSVDHWVVIYGYGRNSARLFVAGQGIPYFARREILWMDFNRKIRPKGFGLVCWGKS